MNEVLQTQLAEVVEIAKNGAIQAVEILKVQMPDLCSQILLYNFWSSLLFLIVPLLGVIVFSITCAYGITKQKESQGKSYSILHDFCMVVGGIFSITCLILLIISFTEGAWFKILLAPKLYLIEYVSALIK